MRIAPSSLLLFCFVVVLAAAAAAGINYRELAEAEWNKYLVSRDPAVGENALNLIQKGVDESPDSWLLRFVLASHCHWLGKDERAWKEAKQAIQKHDLTEPMDAEMTAFYGKTLIYANKLDAALKVFYKVVQKQPLHTESWHRIGTILFEQKKFEQSAQAFIIAGRIGNSAIDYLSAGHVLDQLGNEKSLVMFGRCLSLSPKNDTVAYYEFARSLENFQKTKQAEILMRSISKQVPCEDSYFRLGNTMMTQQKYEEAVGAYNKAVEYNAITPSTYHNLGFSARITGEYELAVWAGKKAVELNINTDKIDPMFVIGLANNIRSLGNYKAALSIARSLRQPHTRGGLVINDYIGVRVPDLQQGLTALTNDKSKWKKTEKKKKQLKEGKNNLVAKAVMLYLIGKKREHYVDLRDSLSCLRTFFLDAFSYPVLILHEGLTIQQMTELTNIYKNISFYLLSFSLPSHIDAGGVKAVVAGHASVGYRHMCRFYSGIIMNLPPLKDYDYYWRVDSDSFILEPITQDPFRIMEAEHINYGFMALGREDEHLTTGLWNATLDFIQKHKVKPKFLNNFVDARGDWDRSYYYTNFEILYLPFFRNSEYMQYFEHLDALSGFYDHRWGDAPIRLLGVSMFADASTVRHFNDISYQHKVFVHVASEPQ